MERLQDLSRAGQPVVDDALGLPLTLDCNQPLATSYQSAAGEEGCCLFLQLFSLIIM